MGSELMLGGFGQGDDRRGLISRASKAQREMQQREQQTGAELLFLARKQEVTAALRHRMTQNAMHDVMDVVVLAERLAGGDPFLAQELTKIVGEFTRTTADDIRTFGNGLGR